jgi:hypothetical protein
MRIAIPTAAVMLVLLVCSAQITFRPPAGTALRQLRAECAELAAWRAEEIRPLATGNDLGSKNVFKSFHYDLESGHCYVLIEENYFSGSLKGVVDKFLIDGKTNKDLASTYYRYGDRSGSIWDEKYEYDTKLTDYDNANKYIKQKMSD